MKKRKLFRLISLIMFLIAIVFVFCALSNPALGRTIYIGDFFFGAEQWRMCYAVYAIVMLLFFIASFFVDRKER